jgi:hypothetical protein
MLKFISCHVPKSPLEMLVESFLETQSPNPLMQLQRYAETYPELKQHLREVMVLWHLRRELAWTYQPLFFRIR